MHLACALLFAISHAWTVKINCMLTKDHPAERSKLIGCEDMAVHESIVEL